MHNVTFTKKNYYKWNNKNVLKCVILSSLALCIGGKLKQKKKNAKLFEFRMTKIFSTNPFWNFELKNISYNEDPTEE